MCTCIIHICIYSLFPVPVVPSRACLLLSSSLGPLKDWWCLLSGHKAVGIACDV